MVGTINLSLTQQLDEFGEPLSGGQLYFIQAGTVSTPQNAYQDTALTIPLPNPVTLDAAGRVPQFFLADGQIKVRLQDVNGIVKFVADNLLVVGPSAGGGGGGSVDATTVMQTGDIKVRYDNVIISGFVRANGRTIGSASSGASELADASAQALFNYLWVKDSTLTVAPGGRGASAAADWAANKTIVLPDCRNRPLVGLADMGNTDTGAFVGVTFGKGNATTLGSFGGGFSKTIPAGAVPAHQHYVYAGVTLHEVAHSHGLNGSSVNFSVGGALNGGGTYGVGSSVSTAVLTGMTVTNTLGSSPGASDNATTYPIAGSGAAFDLSNPFLLITVYLKL